MTRTASNPVLGRLDPDFFCGGAMALDVSLAQAGVARLADELGMSVEQAALAVVEIAGENMANAIRMVSIERGHDPRGFALLAFGGAGPLHAPAVARKLHIPTVIIPPFPGSFSALGLLLGDLRVDKLWTQAFRSDRVDAAEVVERFKVIATAAIAELREQGFAGECQLQYAINMRYLGQNYEAEVDVPPIVALDPAGAAAQLEAAYQAFHNRHRAMYDYVISDAVIEMAGFRVSAIGPVAHPELPLVEPAGSDEDRYRLVCFTPEQPQKCRLLRREAMAIDTELQGPLIVEEEGSTTLIEPGMSVRRSAQDILIITVDA